MSVNSTEKSRWGRQTNQHQHRPSLAPVRWHQCYRGWWFLVAQAVVRYHLLVRRWAEAGSGLRFTNGKDATAAFKSGDYDTAASLFRRASHMLVRSLIVGPADESRVPPRPLVDSSWTRC